MYVDVCVCVFGWVGVFGWVNVWVSVWVVIACIHVHVSLCAHTSKLFVSLKTTVVILLICFIDKR